MKKVLITGVNGYIGRSFESWILNQHKGDLQINFVNVRTNDWKIQCWNEYDVIIHAAGIVHKNEKKVENEEYDRVNHLLSYEVALKAKESGIGHFIFLSTKGVYKPNTEFINKETLPDPQRYYGKSKLAAEFEILLLQSNNFLVSIVRPPTIYGENCPGNFKFLERYSKVIHIFPNIDNERSMIYIWNFCEFLYLLIMNPVRETILFPQNKEYSGSLKLLVLLWKVRNENYCLSNNLAFLTKLLMTNLEIPKLNTMFLDSKYDLSISQYYQNRYCVYSLEESVKNIINSSGEK